MSWVIVSSPFSPRSSSLRDLLISVVRLFILSHSWKQTKIYGVFSSHLARRSVTAKASGIFSMISSTIILTLSSRVELWPPSPPDCLGWSSKTVLNKCSDIEVRKPISALECRPYSSGDS